MKRFYLALALPALLLAQAPAFAGPIFGNVAHSANGLGNFTGALSYSASDDSNATLTVTLTNTSPHGGYITAFVLNNPGDAITGISLSASDSDFTLLGAAPFQNGVNGGPYGQFDFGASTGGGFEGGGNPNLGIAVGSSTTFTFTLTGNGFEALTELSFEDEVSVPPSDGSGNVFMLVRFRGLDAEPGSDKVPTHHNPEPSTLLMSLLGLGAVLPACRRRRG